MTVTAVYIAGENNSVVADLLLGSLVPKPDERLGILPEKPFVLSPVFQPGLARGLRVRAGARALGGRTRMGPGPERETYRQIKAN